MKPKISIVATSRNDNHGGDMTKRMQLFVNGVLEQAKRYSCSMELILVEWNPPVDRPKLKDELKWPDDTSPCVVRIIEVPAEIHQRYKNSEGLPLFQMIAKNVGIVRAKGDFILSTNVDIIFSNELMEFLCKGQLEKGKYYRVDRYDVSRGIPADLHLEEMLDYCRKNTLRISHRDGITDCLNDESVYFYPAFPFVGKRLRKIPFWRQLVKLGKTRVVRTLYRVAGRYRYWVRLHTNACGDFTLMDKEDWFLFRGAPELEIYSLHIDSLVCYMAHFSGIKEVIVDMPTYHIDHGGGWSLQAEKDRSLYNNMKERNVPVLSVKEMDEWISDMHQGKRPVIYNDGNWGLSNESLVETII